MWEMFPPKGTKIDVCSSMQELWKNVNREKDKKICKINYKQDNHKWLQICRPSYWIHYIYTVKLVCAKKVFKDKEETTIDMKC